MSAPAHSESPTRYAFAPQGKRQSPPNPECSTTPPTNSWATPTCVTACPARSALRKPASGGAIQRHVSSACATTGWSSAGCPTPDDLRPGPLWAGPSLLRYVDNCGYLLTVANLPPGSDAFTIDLYIKFLRPAPFDDLIADTRLLRMSKRKADLDILITSPEIPDGPVIHATATFSPRPACRRRELISPGPSHAGTESRRGRVA